jgi:hypothetical protein
MVVASLDLGTIDRTGLSAVISCGYDITGTFLNAAQAVLRAFSPRPPVFHDAVNGFMGRGGGGRRGCRQRRQTKALGSVHHANLRWINVVLHSHFGHVDARVGLAGQRSAEASAPGGGAQLGIGCDLAEGRAVVVRHVQAP